MNLLKKITAVCALIASISILMTFSAAAANFTDTDGHWAKDTITALADKGIINGTSDTTFNPDGAVTRAEFLKMVMNAVGIAPYDSVADKVLDASPDEWYAVYLKSALDKGLIPSSMVMSYSETVNTWTDENGNTASGVTYGGAFSGGLSISREEMAFIASEMYQYVLNPSMMKKMQPAKTTDFTDKSEIADWAVSGVNFACANGFVLGMGDGSFQPEGSTTRAQAAVVISRIMALISEG